MGCSMRSVATRPCAAGTVAALFLSASILPADAAPLRRPQVKSPAAPSPAATTREAPGTAAVTGEDALLAAMLSLITTHDISILVGVAPLPATSYTAEAIELASDLALKTLPARLFAPADREVDPNAPAGPGYTTDGCGIEFRLLSPRASFTNMFGIASFRDPYTQLSPFQIYPWRNRSDPDDVNAETRWGFLRAPSLYHANTDVRLEIITPAEVRRYDPATGQLGAPYVPVDSAAESPQQVYLPIGQHGIEWRATTEMNVITDAVIPGAMLAFNVLSELKNLYGGAQAARLAKKSGIGEEVADEALDPQGAKRLSDGVKKFNDVWQKAFEDRQARKAATAAEKLTQKLRQKLRDSIKKKVKDTLQDVLKNLAKAGFNSIDGGTRDQVKAIVGPAAAEVVGIVWSVYSERYPAAAHSIEFVIANLDGNLLTIIRRIIATRGVQLLIDLLSVDTAQTSRVQTITVWDASPPNIDIDPTPVVVEATDFGGTRLARIRTQLTELVQDSVTDNCGRTPELILSGPELLRLGAQQVTWTARDRGPNPADGRDYAPTAVQNILVRDTQPPLLLAPPSKVILDTAPVALADAAIGNAAAIDLVDVQPQVTNDAPASFPVNARTNVQWVARDGSGNEAQAAQLITVKDSNTPPTAHTATAATLTAQPVDIRLTAGDVDELGGRFDPLWFRIESPPSHGEFVAPLYPFFIEDYRTRPNDGLGQDYDPESDEIFAFVGAKYCDRDLPVREPPRGFVHDATYVHVTDDGIRYVLDSFFVCDPFDDKALTQRRFSKWTRDGGFLGQMQIGTNPEDWPLGDAFRVDRDGFLYYNNDLEPGSSSNELYLWRCPVDWEGRDNLTNASCARAYRFDGSSAPGNVVDARSLAYARVDSRLDVAYVADGHSLLAFELLDTGGTRFLGEIGPKDDAGEVLDGWFGEITSLEVGSDGALYANDADWHRIHKLAPITHDENGEFVLGEYVGWAGKCTGSSNNACEEDSVNPANGRSRGYSCTYAPDSCTVAPAERAGARQGQFNTPRYVALDPNDILYVADYENLRIQRLSPDGSFAGEAVSSGSGVNQGDRPSFILGNMGKPASVAVNSTQFFVVDRDEHFVHVFGTLPFKDITEDAVTVTYVSDQDFPNPAVMDDDSFSFSVTDGLARSTPATVTVTVSRNFRPPVALSETITTAEDASVPFTLPARDPDGIAGKDFLGLDTLTYTLTRWPENGSLSGYGDSWTYTPHPDFYGEDSLRFRVNDGLEDSDEGTLTFEVTPVSDPPVITALERPERVALGFPTQVSTSFTDDRVDGISAAVPDGHADGYDGTVSWGDGTHDTTGDFTNDEGDVGATGVTVIAPASAEAEGSTLATHTYEVPGPRTVQACVVDEGGLAACSSATINVEPLVSMGITGIFYDAPLPEDEVTMQEIGDGRDFTFEVTVVNAQPSVGDGLPAADVTLDLDLPAGLAIRDIAIGQGNCTRDTLAVTCVIGTLEPGAEVRLTMTGTGPGDLVYDQDQEFEGTLHTSSDAVEPEVGLFATVTIVADTTDADGDGMSDTFEQTHGLNPAMDDGSGDADGDGLTNVDEYETGSSPRDPDTDGDGVGDGAEIDAGGNPLLDDVAPVLAAPADVEVNATGALTRVDIGTTGAVDFKDGPVQAVANDTGPFPPGVNVVTWSAVDASGNRADAFQLVNVVPLASFPVDRFVFEGDDVRVRVELNGPAVTYPVTVPYTVSGTAVNPGDHDRASGEVVIASGLAAEIRIRVAKDAIPEPDETIVLTMGTPNHAVVGEQSTHTITVTEVNRPPQVLIGVEQQGRATTTIVSSAGLIGLLTTVRDDLAQQHAFDWSASDSALVDPVAVNDPGYLLDPSGLGAGLYDLRVTVTDDGLVPLASSTSSLLRVIDAPLLLRGDEDSDGDGLSDAAEGPWDTDGDRVPDYLDDSPHSNLLRLGADGRLLEILTGLDLRLGATAFGQGSAFATVKEGDLGTDVDFGFSSDVPDFEVTRLEPGGSAQVVIPLAHPVSEGAAYRVHAGGQWQDFVEDAGNHVATAPGAKGACPPPASDAYGAGLTAPHGCLQLTLSDGGPNDRDGVADGTIRIIGGLAAPVSAGVSPMTQPKTVLAGDGEAVMVRARLHSDSGDALLRSLTLQARGTRDERLVDDVILVHDANRDGQWDDDDVVLARARYALDDGSLTLQLDAPLEVPVGDTDLLVIYVFGDLE